MRSGRAAWCCREETGHGRENRVNLIALGDVGGTVLMGLRLLGGDVISSIGIYDLNEKRREAV